MTKLGNLTAGTDPLLTNDAIHAGLIVFWPGLVVPAGWLKCDGSSLLRATYAVLFAEIGTDYGAADGTHFSLPNMVRRMPVAPNVGTNRGGASGGGLSHIHGRGTLSQPAHNHPAGGLYLPDHGHGHNLSAPNHKHNIPVTGGPNASSPTDVAATFSSTALVQPGLSGGILGSGNVVATGITGDSAAALLTGSTDVGDAPAVAVDFIIKT